MSRLFISYATKWINNIHLKNKFIYTRTWLTQQIKCPLRQSITMEILYIAFAFDHSKII